MTVSDSGTQSFRFALAGCGEIAVANARAIAATDAASLSACIDPDERLAQDLAKRHGGTAFASLGKALIATAFDAVIVSTPHHLHRPIALEALEAGKHVIVEKPLGRDLAEAREIVAAARTHRAQVSVFFPMRYRPEIVWAREFIARGGVGKVLGIRIVDHLYKEMAYWTGGASGRSRVAWRGIREKSGGGVLIMNIIHLLDLVRHLTGLEVGRVYAEHDTLDTPVDVEDTVAMVVKFESKAIGMIDASTCMVGDGPKDLRIWGSDGQIVLTKPYRYISLKSGAGSAIGEWRRLPRLEGLPERAGFLREFVTAVQAGQAAPSSGKEGLLIQAVIDAAYMSMTEGRPIRPADLIAAVQAK